MPTISQVQEVVYRLRVEDQATDAAKAAAAAIGTVNAAIDAGEQVVARATRSAQSLINQYDTTAKSALALGRAQRDLQAIQAAQAADAAAGGSKADALARAFDAAAVKVVALTNAVAAGTMANAAASDAAARAAAGYDTIAAAAQRAMGATQAQAEAQARANSFANVQPDDGMAQGYTYAERAKQIADYGNQMDAVRAKYDPLFRVSKQYEGALNDISTAQKTGAISASVAEAATARVNDAFAKGRDVAAAATGTLGAATEAHGKFSLATAGATRELIVLGHEVLVGNYNRIPGSLVVMAERAGGLHDIIAKVGSIATSTGGLIGIAAVVGIAALTALGVAAEHEATRMGDLREALRATHDDYGALADQVDLVSRRAAASTTLTLADARTAAETIAGAKYFSGTAADLQRLTSMSADLARVWNTDVAKAAKTLAGALDDPAAAAKKFASEGMPAFTSELVRAIDLMQMGGERSAAFGLVLGALSKSSSDATRDVSPLRQALHDLENAFYGTQNGGKSLAVQLGSLVDGAAAVAIRAITEAINLLKIAMDGANSALDRASAIINLTNPGSLFGVRVQLGAGTAASGTAQISGGVTSSSAPADYAGLRDQVAALVGIDAEALRRVQASEGLFKNGQWVTSSAGAVGGMQVKPGTFDMMQQKYGFPGSITEDRANLFAGAYYLKENLQAAHGDLTVATLGYHDGSGILQPGSTAQPSRDALIQATKVGDGYTGQALVTPQMVNDARALNDQLADQVKNTRDIKDQALDRQLSEVQKQMVSVAASAGTDSAEYKGLVQRSQELTAEKYKNVDAQTAATRAEQSALAASAGLTAGEQGLNAELEKRRQIALTTGSPFGSAEQQQATVDYLDKQSQAFERTSYSMATTTHNNAELATAYDKGGQSVLDATAKQQAFAKSLDLFPAGSANQAAAFRALTPLYADLARSAAEVQTAQQNAAGRNNIAYIQEETRTLGLDEDTRTRRLAVMKAEQEMNLKYGETLPQVAKDYIELAGRTADATAALTHQKAAYDELTGFVDHTFSTISDSIVQAFAQGEKSAVKFADVAKSVVSAIEAEFIKLALINPLKDAFLGTTSPNLFSVGGIVGQLLGNNGVPNVTATAVSAGSALGNLDNPFAGAGTTSDVNGVPAATTATSSGGLLQAAGTLGTLAKGLDIISGGKLLSGITDTIKSAVGYTSGQSLGSFVSETVGEVPAGTFAANAAAGAAANSATGLGASEIAAGLPGAASDVGSLGATAVAGASQAAEVGTIGTAAGQIADAIPYIGTAISVITDLAQGNYRGAGLVAGGAATGAVVGTFVFPGLGTAAGAAIGAVAGGLLDAFLPNHPKHPYQNTEVDIQGGQIVAGKQVHQLENTAAAVSSINDFNTQLQGYMHQVGVVITNTDGIIGNLGNNIKGMVQVTSVTDLFSHLQFGNDPSDTSNFGVAKGALGGMSFPDIGALTTELAKIAGFADAVTAVGINLASVGKDLTNIQVASVVQDGGQLRTALQHDLPGQTFANVDALSAEIDKVNQFVNGTLPGLLDPTIKTSSAIVDAMTKTLGTYQDAIAQATKYGLATDALTEAQGRALAMIQAPALAAITASEVGMVGRHVDATMGSGATTAYDALAQFDAAGQSQVDALKKLYTDAFGDLGTTSAGYLTDLNTLEQVRGEERVKIVQGIADAEKAALDTINVSVASIQGRADVLAGNQQAADLVNADAKAVQEKDAYSKSLLDYYGQSYAQSTEYQQRMTQLEQVQEGERAAIAQKYATAAATAAQQAQATAVSDAHTAYTNAQTAFTAAQQALETALNDMITTTNSQISTIKANTDALHAAATSMQTFTASLDTSSSSPLSPTEQLRAAESAYKADYAKVIDPTLTAADRASAATTMQSDGTAVLNQAANYYGKSTQGYAGYFDWVKSASASAASLLDTGASVGDQQISILQQQLAVMTSQLAVTKQVGADGTKTISELNSDMMVAFDALRTSLDNLNQIDPTAQTKQLEAVFNAQAKVLAASVTSQNQVLDYLTKVQAAQVADHQAAAAAAISGTATSQLSSTAQSLVDAGGSGAQQLALQANSLANQLQDASSTALQTELAAENTAAQQAAAAAAAAAAASAASAAAAAAQRAASAASAAWMASFSANWVASATGNGPPIAVAPDVQAPTSFTGSQQSDYNTELNIQADYVQYVGRPASLSELQTQIAAIESGNASFVSIIDNLKATPEAKARGYAAGGFVANGLWGIDSVSAPMLAGGEFVVPAAPAAQFADILPSIRAGSFHPANDSDAVVAELRALRAAVAALTRANGVGSQAVVGAVREGTAVQRQSGRRAVLAGKPT